MPDASIKEAKKRVNAAIKNSNIEFPSKKILINLAPANMKKEGSSFDLAISVRNINCNRSSISKQCSIKSVPWTLSIPWSIEKD